MKEKSMNKWIISLTLAALLVLALAGSALAQATTGLTVVKGSVSVLEAGSITVESVKGGTFTFALPAELVLPELKIGDLVMVKGETQTDGSLLAVDLRSLVKGKGRGQGAGAGTPGENGLLNRAYCDPNKQGVYHPLSEKLAQRYGVTPEWVTGYYCDGQSMGGILLALKTAQMQGGDPDGLLLRRANGEGWGQIWQGLGLIGSEQDAWAPPGQLKK
jgi:hypothetical protein